MSDEVGKVSLGLELVTGNDLTKQITAAAGTIGQQLTKSLQSTFGGFSLKGFASNISQTLKATTETAMKGIVDGMEQSVAAVEGRLLKMVGTADKVMKDSIQSSKTAAESAIDSMEAKLSKLGMPVLPAESAPIVAQPAAAATPTVASPKASTKVKAPELDTGAAKAEIESLNAVLDNTNAKIEIQERKLADLRDAYENTFNDARKNKIQEKIVNAEGALLRLTSASDKTAQKIWKIEDSLKEAEKAAAAAAKPITDLGNHMQHTGQAAQATAQAIQAAAKPAKQLGMNMNQANKPVKAAKGNLDQAAQAAAGAGSSFNNAGRNANKMGNSFTQAMGRILKQVFVFAVLYKAIRGFNDYMMGALKTNAQFAASLNAIQTNLRVAFQPIYEAILPAINALMSFLAKATAYIAAFISALFGKTYQQSYQAAKGIETAKKAMEGYGKKAKKAGKEAKGALAGFDELNTLDFSKNDAGVDDGGGGGGGSKGFEMQMPDMDITGIQAKMDELAAQVKAAFDSAWKGVKSGWDWLVSTFGPSFQAAWGEISPVLDRWKAQFQKMFTDVISLGEPLKNWILTGLVPFWQQGIELAGHVLAGLLDTILNIVTSIWDAAFPILEKFVKEGLPRITEFLTGAQDVFRKLFDLVKKIFDDIWKGVVDPVMKLISKIIQDTLDIIFKWWDNWGKKIMDGLKKTVDKLKELWTSLWEKFLKPITQSALKFLTDLWDKHLKGLVEEVLDFVGKLAKAALDIFNEFVLPIVNWLVKKLGPIFAEIFDGILDVIDDALGGIIDAAKGIVKALGGIVEFIAGVFTGDWKRAWEGIKTFTSGIGDAIVAIFKGAVNAVIDALNWMIKQVNKISIDIPDWVPGAGGKTMGFSVPTIPKLAKGGLAYGPTLAMVGDNKGAAADPEVISPLSTLQDMLGSSNQAVVDVLTMILAALHDNNKGQEAVLKIGETEFGRIAARAIGSAERQAGRPLLAR
ncbi:MAG: phage tail protein [Bacillota bacterium]